MSKNVGHYFLGKKGILLVDFVEHGTTLTDNVYCDTLNKLRCSIQNKRCRKLSCGLILLGDNKCPLTAARTSRKYNIFVENFLVAHRTVPTLGGELRCRGVEEYGGAILKMLRRDRRLCGEVKYVPQCDLCEHTHTTNSWARLRAPSKL